MLYPVNKECSVRQSPEEHIRIVFDANFLCDNLEEANRISALFNSPEFERIVNTYIMNTRQVQSQRNSELARDLQVMHGQFINSEQNAINDFYTERREITREPLAQTSQEQTIQQIMNAPNDFYTRNERLAREAMANRELINELIKDAILAHQNKLKQKALEEKQNSEKKISEINSTTNAINLLDLVEEDRNENENENENETKESEKIIASNIVFENENFRIVYDDEDNEYYDEINKYFYNVYGESEDKDYLPF